MSSDCTLGTCARSRCHKIKTKAASSSPPGSPLWPRDKVYIQLSIQNPWSGLNLAFQILVLLLPALHIPCAPATSVHTMPHTAWTSVRTIPHTLDGAGRCALLTLCLRASSLPAEIFPMFFLIKRGVSWTLDEPFKQHVRPGDQSACSCPRATAPSSRLLWS